MAPEYFLISPKGEENLGSARLSSVVAAAVDVFSSKGGKKCSLQNALVLGAVENAAIEAATNKVEIQAEIERAYELGQKIGLALRENNASDKKSKVSFVQRG